MQWRKVKNQRERAQCVHVSECVRACMRERECACVRVRSHWEGGLCIHAQSPSLTIPLGVLLPGDTHSPFPLFLAERGAQNIKLCAIVPGDTKAARVPRVDHYTQPPDAAVPPTTNPHFDPPPSGAGPSITTHKSHDTENSIRRSLIHSGTPQT